MRTLFIMFLVSLPFLSFAQNSTRERSFELTFGLSNTEWSNESITIERQVGEINYIYRLEDVQQTGLSISLGKERSDGWRQSWGIVQANYTTQDNIAVADNTNTFEPLGGQRNQYTILHLRWAYGRIISPLSSDKLRVSAHLGIDPIFQHLRVSPKTSAGFPLQYTRLGLSANLISSFELKLANRLWLALHAAASFHQATWDKSRLENPILPEEQQTVTQVNSQFRLFPQQVMLGVTYELCEG